MVIDIKTKEAVNEHTLTIGDLVTYLNSFGQELQQVLNFPIITNDGGFETVTLTPDGLILD